jgi:hypothetical protein
MVTSAILMVAMHAGWIFGLDVINHCMVHLHINMRQLDLTHLRHGMQLHIQVAQLDILLIHPHRKLCSMMIGDVTLLKL